MKDRLRILPMKAFSAFCLLVILFPISLLIGQAVLPESPLVWYIPSVFSLLWGIGGFFLPTKGRMPFALVGCALLIVGAVLFLIPSGWPAVLLILPCIVYLLLLPPSWSRVIGEEWNSSLWLAGVVLHFAGLIASGWPRFAPAAVHFLSAFVLYLFLFLLYLNRSSLRDGMHGSEKTPAFLKRRNTVLVIAVFFIAALAACWKTLGEWVDIAWQYIKLGIWKVIDFLLRFFPEQSAGAGGSGGGDAGMLAELGEETGPSSFALIMEKVFMVLAAILLLALLVLALRVIYRNVKKLWQRLMERLHQYAANSGEDYIDEAESTLNWDEKTQSVLDRLQKAVTGPRQPKWEDLDGRDRVRRLYWQYLRKKPEEKAKTAREALKAEKRLSSAQINSFTQLYEKARYSDHTVSTQEADQLKNNIKI